MPNYSVKFAESIEDIGLDTWQRIAGYDYPFMRYEFLHALETARSNNLEKPPSEAACSRRSGWQPHHALVSDEHGLVAVMPLYLKYHSYGEYIFDWAWAEAYQRNGLDYYPKLLTAIPYSPVTGPRIAIDPAIDAKATFNSQDLIKWLAEVMQEHCTSIGASSFHLLYPEGDVCRILAAQGVTARHSYQYHWFNNTNGEQAALSKQGKFQQGTMFNDFEHFCAHLKSRKRKVILKERREVVQQGITMERLVGDAITPEIWQQFYQFYQLTYAKRSGHGGYLNGEFFQEIGRTMADQLMLVVAKKDNEVIAGALNFFSSTTLYGRYWGCTEEAEFLHFEACYYQGIEFCIEKNLQRFDAGAQGEHKIQRGFRPVDTYSNHWIAHPGFREAINAYMDQERQQNQQHMDLSAQKLPFSPLQTTEVDSAT
ncbi:MAG: GNAT family N-acetyltransferase [Pseudomonadales bacterium]|nr:GNAT family N-acetyltransferase [Pseudomonadales bacterium]